MDQEPYRWHYAKAQITRAGTGSSRLAEWPGLIGESANESLTYSWPAVKDSVPRNELQNFHRDAAHGRCSDKLK